MTYDRMLRLELPETLAALDTPAFAETLQRELTAQVDRLPLQESLQRTDRALTDDIRIVPLRVEKGEGAVRIRVGIFYQGILAGSCCADDPTPVEPEVEYCEFTILTKPCCPSGKDPV